MRCLFLVFVINILLISCNRKAKILFEANQLKIAADSSYNALSPEDALLNYQKAAILYLKLDNYNNYVKCKLNIAQCYLILQQGKQAIQQLDSLINFQIQSEVISSLQIGSIYYLLGIAYFTISDYQKSIQALENALDIYQLSNKKYKILNTYLCLGAGHKSLGNYEPARYFYNKALEHLLPTSPNYHRDLANIYTSIGLLFNTEHKHDSAARYHQNVIALRMQMSPTPDRLIASSYNNLGLVFENKQVYDSALVYYQKSLKYHQKTSNFPNTTHIGIFRNLANVYQKQEAYVKAQETYDTLLKLMEQLREKDLNRANIYHQLANFYEVQGKYPQALDYYQQALIAGVHGFESSAISKNPPLEGYLQAQDLLKSLGAKANTLCKWYKINKQDRTKLELANKTYLLADQLIQKMRQEILLEGDRLALSEEAYQIYQGAMEVVWEMPLTQRDSLAFYYLERSKAQLLAQSIQDSRAKSVANIPSSLLEEEKNLKIDRAYYQRKLTGRLKPDLKRQYQDSLFNINQRYQVFIQNLEKNYPKYYAYKYAHQVLTASEVQAQLKADMNATLLEYIIGQEHLYIFAINQEHMNLRRVPKNNLEQLITSYRRALVFERKKKFIESASALYQILIEPIQDMIYNKSKVQVIADGNLHLVPWETLLTHSDISTSEKYANLPYFFRDYAVSYASSATLLFQNRETSNQSNKPLWGDFLAFAPVFDQDNEVMAASDRYILTDSVQEHNMIVSNERQILLDPVQKRLSPLKYSSQEVQNIEKLTKENGKKTRVFLREEATEDQLKENIEHYRYVHIATHSEANRHNRHLCYVAFIQPEEVEYTTAGQLRDGTLYVGEILGLELQADLLALSSCNTGLGRTIPGEGILSLLRAFTYAGAKNIIYTLWKVDDEQTAKLLALFYQSFLNEGLPYPEALRQAKIKLLELGDNIPPRKWAGVILQGH